MPQPGSAGSPAASPSAGLPAWLLSDWPVVGVAVLITVLILAVASIAYGMVTAFAVAGGADALVGGLRVGAYLGFASFGAEVQVLTGGGDFNGLFGSSYLPLPWLVVGLVAILAGQMFGSVRVATNRNELVAFVVKFSVVLAAVLAILGAVMSVGDLNQGDDFVARVSTATLFFSSLFFSLVLGAALLIRRGRLDAPWISRVRQAPAWAAIGRGFVAFGGVVVVSGVLAFVAALWVVDDWRQRVGILLGSVFTVVNFGFQSAIVSMGGSVGLGGEGVDNVFGDPGVSSDHISLFHWGFPPASDAGAAPLYLFVLLLLAPVAVAIVTRHVLDARKPTSEQALFGTAFSVAGGFLLASLLAGVFGRVLIAVAASNSDGEGAGFFGALRPSVASAVLLGLLWGVVGAFGAAAWWGKSHGMNLGLSRAAGDAAPHGPQSVAPSAPPIPPTPPASAAPPAPSPPPAPSQQASPPPAGAEATNAFCTSCGTRLPEGAAFCPSCGTRTG